MDYLRHVIDLADVLYALADIYRRRRQSFRVGIGSICRRAQVPEIRRIVAAIAAVLPGIPLRLAPAAETARRGLEAKRLLACLFEPGSPCLAARLQANGMGNHSRLPSCEHHALRPRSPSSRA